MGQSELQDAGKVAEQNEVGKNPGNVAGGLKAYVTTCLDLFDANVDTELSTIPTTPRMASRLLRRS